MNIVIVMSGGSGERFDSPVPKQYNLIAGRPVIDYVLDAVDGSRGTDKAVIVMDERWAGYSKKAMSGVYDIAPNGETRIRSLYNGLRHIKDRYPCKKVVVIDSVAPFITGALIDEYFDRLDVYDAAITAQRITGGFTDIHDNLLDRDDYIITQSPEGFRFDLLWDNYNLDFAYQETAGMLPAGSRRFYNYGFTNNLKLTYGFELSYCEHMLRDLGRVRDDADTAYFDKSLLITEGLRSFLLRRQEGETISFIDGVYRDLPKLIDRWGISRFMPVQTSRYGLVLKARSAVHGDVVLKFIPGFVGRYERELEAMRLLPRSYMCELLDSDDECRCMLLRQVVPAGRARFEDVGKLDELFSRAVGGAVPCVEGEGLRHIPPYLEELEGKLAGIADVPYCREEVERELTFAVELYREVFADAELYVLHGDLHEDNILDDGERLWGIDPNGMLAPIELECVRFIRNDVRSHADVGYGRRFDLLLRHMARFADIGHLCAMFIIDMAFCTYSSTFENESPAETLVDLELIRIAKRWLEEGR